MRKNCRHVQRGACSDFSRRILVVTATGFVHVLRLTDFFELDKCIVAVAGLSAHTLSHCERTCGIYRTKAPGGCAFLGITYACCVLMFEQAHFALFVDLYVGGHYVGADVSADGGTFLFASSCASSHPLYQVRG